MDAGSRCDNIPLSKLRNSYIHVCSRQGCYIKDWLKCTNAVISRCLCPYSQKKLFYEINFKDEKEDSIISSNNISRYRFYRSSPKLLEDDTKLEITDTYVLEDFNSKSWRFSTEMKAFVKVVQHVSVYGITEAILNSIKEKSQEEIGYVVDEIELQKYYNPQRQERYDMMKLQADIKQDAIGGYVLSNVEDASINHSDYSSEEYISADEDINTTDSKKNTNMKVTGKRNPVLHVSSIVCLAEQYRYLKFEIEFYFLSHGKNEFVKGEGKLIRAISRNEWMNLDMESYNNRLSTLGMNQNCKGLCFTLAEAGFIYDGNVHGTVKCFRCEGRVQDLSIKDVYQIHKSGCEFLQSRGHSCNLVINQYSNTRLERTEEVCMFERDTCMNLETKRVMIQESYLKQEPTSLALESYVHERQNNLQNHSIIREDGYQYHTEVHSEDDEIQVEGATAAVAAPASPQSGIDIKYHVTDPPESKEMFYTNDETVDGHTRSESASDEERTTSAESLYLVKVDGHQELVTYNNKSRGQPTDREPHNYKFCGFLDRGIDMMPYRYVEEIADSLNQPGWIRLAELIGIYSEELDSHSSNPSRDLLDRLIRVTKMTTRDLQSKLRQCGVEYTARLVETQRQRFYEDDQPSSCNLSRRERTNKQSRDAFNPSNSNRRQERIKKSNYPHKEKLPRKIPVVKEKEQFRQNDYLKNEMLVEKEASIQEVETDKTNRHDIQDIDSHHDMAQQYHFTTDGNPLNRAEGININEDLHLDHSCASGEYCQEREKLNENLVEDLKNATHDNFDFILKFEENSCQENTSKKQLVTGPNADPGFNLATPSLRSHHDNEKLGEPPEQDPENLTYDKQNLNLEAEVQRTSSMPFRDVKNSNPSLTNEHALSSTIRCSFEYVQRLYNNSREISVPDGSSQTNLKEINEDSCENTNAEGPAEQEQTSMQYHRRTDLSRRHSF